MKKFIMFLFLLFIGLLISDVFILQLPITLKLIIKDIITSVISLAIILIIDKKINCDKKTKKQ